MRDPDKPMKPQIEEISQAYLEGEMRENLLDFVAWMRANRITPTFANKSKIGVNYTSRVCYLKLFHGSWYIWPAGRKNEYVSDFLDCKELEDIVCMSLFKCIGCGHQCNAGTGFTKSVCGKDFENICGCCPVRFHNPNAKTLEIIKKVIENRNNGRK